MVTSTTSRPRRQRRRQFLQKRGRRRRRPGRRSAPRQAPALAQTRELTFLTIASFVPDTDKELKRQFEEWGKQNKVKVRLDIIAHLQLQTKKAAEVQAKSGHDLTALGPGLGDAALYYDYLVDLADLAGEVGPKNGGWLRPEDYLIRNKWTLLPWLAATLPDGDQDRRAEEARRGGARHLGGLAARRQEGQGDRPSVRHRDGPQRRCQRDAAVDPLVLRRLLHRQGRRDRHHQFARRPARRWSS